MVKIVEFFKNWAQYYNDACQDLSDMNMYIIPIGYTYVIIYLNPELDTKIRNTDQTYSENSSR